MRGTRGLTFFLVGAAVVVACGGDDTGGGTSTDGGGADASTSNDGSTTQPGTDASNPTDGGPGTDASIDASHDGSIEASTDSGVDSGEDAGDDAGEPPPPPPPPPPYTHYDINHVLSTGASDSVANGASAWITTTQPFDNVSFDTGVMTAGTCDGSGCKVYQTPASFVPLKEGDKFFAYSVETISSGLANQTTALSNTYFANNGLAGERHDMLVSLHGRSGNPYWCERLQSANVQPGFGPCYFAASNKYIAPFDEAMMQVQSAKTIATNMGKSYVVRGVTAIAGQGESDTMEQNFTFLVSTDGANRRINNYTEALFDWQWDYETKVQAITGQAEPVPFFISQFGSMSNMTPLFSLIPQRQLDAHIQSNGKINLVTPNYPFQHYTDCLHYTAHSQRRLGAYFAKAYEKVVIEGGKWEPTRPDSITRVGNKIVVKYVVPVPPLVIDTTRIAAYVPANYDITPVQGFVFRDSTLSASITNVAVTAPDEMTITLSNAPTGNNKILRYAYERQKANACPGPTAGARGNIRDSDTSTGYHTDANGVPYELFNWSVAYQLDVP